MSIQSLFLLLNTINIIQAKIDKAPKNKQVYLIILGCLLILTFLILFWSSFLEFTIYRLI